MDNLQYTLKRSSRKTICIRILQNGTVLVTAPYHTPAAEINRFVQSKDSWIRKTLQKVESENRSTGEPFTDAEIRLMRKHMRERLPELVRRQAAVIGVSYGNISIRMQKSRWGSCSSKGNLNFNCLLDRAPAEVLEYVVIHELCHRMEMNHSDRFWALLQRYCPDYKNRIRWLKEEGGALMRRAGK